MRTGVPWLFFSFCPADSPQLTAFSGSLKLAAIMKPLSSENALTSPPPLSRGTALTSPNKPPLRRQPCPLLNWWIAPPRCSDRRQPMCRSKGNVPICLRHLSMYTDHYSRTVETWIIHSHSNMKLWCAPVMLGKGRGRRQQFNIRGLYCLAFCALLYSSPSAYQHERAEGGVDLWQSLICKITLLGGWGWGGCHQNVVSGSVGSSKNMSVQLTQTPCSMYGPRGIEKHTVSDRGCLPCPEHLGDTTAHHLQQHTVKRQSPTGLKHIMSNNGVWDRSNSHLSSTTAQERIFSA